jgi:hypothetical protein
MLVVAPMFHLMHHCHTALAMGGVDGRSDCRGGGRPTVGATHSPMGIPRTNRGCLDMLKPSYCCS